MKQIVGWMKGELTVPVPLCLLAIILIFLCLTYDTTQVFAHFDVLDFNMNRIAEGHKVCNFFNFLVGHTVTLPL